MTTLSRQQVDDFGKVLNAIPPKSLTTNQQRNLRKTCLQLFDAQKPAEKPPVDAKWWTDSRVPFRIELPHGIVVAHSSAQDWSTQRLEHVRALIVAVNFPGYGLFAADLHDALIDVDLVQGATLENGQKCLRIGGERVVIRGKADNTKGGNDLVLFFANDGAIIDFDGAGGQLHFGVPINNVSQYDSTLRTMYLIDSVHRYGNQQTIPQCITVGARMKKLVIRNHKEYGGSSFIGIENPATGDPVAEVEITNSFWNDQKVTAAMCRGNLAGLKIN